MIAAPVPEPSEPIAVVSERVAPTLLASPELRSLPVARQQRLVQDVVEAAAAAARAIAVRDGTASATALTGSVDFPTFVTDLIRGTFESIVNASVRQVEAYIELLRNVAKPVDQFMHDNVVDEGDDDDGLRRAAARQQELATMVLMGINRLVVTKGKITASAAVELTPRRRRPPP